MDGWFKVEHKEIIGDNTFYFGPVVNRIEGGKPGRPECIAFVKIGEVLQPRLFYLSNSDGGWKLRRTFVRMVVTQKEITFITHRKRNLQKRS